MVRHRQRTTERGKNGAQVQKAAQAMIKDGMSLRRATREFKVSRSSLQKYARKLKANIDEGNHDLPKMGYDVQRLQKQVFSDEQEYAFVTSLFQAANPCYYFTIKEVRRFAYIFADANKLTFPRGWSEKGTAGADWFTGFRKRHSELAELPWKRRKGTNETNAIHWTVPILSGRPTQLGAPAEPNISSEASQQSPPCGKHQSSGASQPSTPSGDLQQSTMIHFVPGAPQLNMPSETSQLNTASETSQPNIPTTQSTSVVSHSSQPSGSSQPSTSTAAFPMVPMKDTLHKNMNSRQQSKPQRTPVPAETTAPHHNQQSMLDHPHSGKPDLGFLIPQLALQLSDIIPADESSMHYAINPAPVPRGIVTSTAPRPSAAPVSPQKSSQFQPIVLPDRPTQPGILAEPNISSEASQQSPPSVVQHRASKESQESPPAGEHQASEASQFGLPPAELNVPSEASRSSMPFVDLKPSSLSTQNTLPRAPQSNINMPPSGKHQSSGASQPSTPSGELQSSILSQQSTVHFVPATSQLNAPSETSQLNAPSETSQPNIPTTQSASEGSHSSQPSGSSHQPSTSTAAFPMKMEDTLFTRVKSRKQSKPRRTLLPQETTSPHQQSIVNHPTSGQPDLGFLIPQLALQLSDIIPAECPMQCAIDRIPVSSGGETSTVPRPNAIPFSLHKSSQCQEFPSKQELRHLGVDEIGKILQKLNIPDNVVQNFQTKNIDGELFVHLTDEMFGELGVSHLTN